MEVPTAIPVCQRLVSPLSGAYDIRGWLHVMSSHWVISQAPGLIRCLREEDCSATNPRVQHSGFVACDPLRDGCALLAASALLLAWPVNFGVHNPHVPCQGIIAREGLFLGAQMTADLFLAGIVDRVFVPRKIVRSGENRVAGLPCRRICPLTLVGTSL